MRASTITGLGRWLLTAAICAALSPAAAGAAPGLLVANDGTDAVTQYAGGRPGIPLPWRRWPVRLPEVAVRDSSRPRMSATQRLTIRVARAPAARHLIRPR
jgi:hypothetical protein